MNRKMFALVLVVVIGVLAVSAFSWTPDHESNHEGLNAYHLSERSSYAEFYLLATNQQGMAIYHKSERANYAGISALDAAEASAYRYTAMAKYYTAQQVEIPVTGENLTTMSAADISAFRWDAMAKFYAGDQAAVVYGPPGR